MVQWHSCPLPINQITNVLNVDTGTKDIKTQLPLNLLKWISHPKLCHHLLTLNSSKPE